MPTLFELLCNPTPGQIQESHNSGKLVNSPEAIEQASQAIFRFLSHHQIDPGDPQAAVGTIFGLGQLKAFVDAIDAYNASSATPTEAKVDAVRIYRARGPYQAPNSTEPPVEVDEVVLVPTQVNDQDVFKVFPLERTPIYMLAQGTPCPNLCNTYFFRNA